MTVEAFSASSIANRLRNSPFLLQVLACSFASTPEFVREYSRVRCEYSRVRLRVITSSFASTHEFVCEFSRTHARGSPPAHLRVSTRMWAVHHSRVLAHARKSYSRVMLRVT